MLNKDNSGYDNKIEPSPGFTLRATIDCERDEIYVFSVRISNIYLFFHPLTNLCTVSKELKQTKRPQRYSAA